MTGERTGRERTCADIAAARGRHVRERARAAGVSPLKGEILLGVTAVASFMTNIVMLPFRRRSIPSRDPAPEHPTPRELGVPDPLRPRLVGTLHGRYGARPSMERLMRDLRRPVARDAALAALLARLGSDAATRAWLQAQVDADDLRRVVVYVRPEMSETEIIEAWRSAAAAEAASRERHAPVAPERDSATPAGFR